MIGCSVWPADIFIGHIYVFERSIDEQRLRAAGHPLNGDVWITPHWYGRYDRQWVGLLSWPLAEP